ncbi:MAG: DegT/DnrJ/EryC1/StrS family aminotransferase [Ruminococcaceae bacterium]|nr:DegT/DnrJ/EryC1/StrS family aminotransferase [Oscillospiraceae bacterium]
MSKLALLGGQQTVTEDVRGANGRWPWYSYVTPEGKALVNQIMDEQTLSEHHVITDFEEAFRNYVGAKYSLSFCTGTASIMTGLFGMGIGRGDEVIVPSYTFFATCTPVMALGGIPVFADVDLETRTLDPVDIERKITPKTKAIVVVHVHGNPADMDAIMAIAKKHDLKVLEDCSHAHGAKYKGKYVGTIGHVGCFSLQASKLLWGGEAGIMVTNDENIYARTAAHSSYERFYPAYYEKVGLSPDNDYIKYAITGLACKLRPHPLAIAIAYCELPHLDEQNKIRNALGKRLDDGIADIPYLHPFKVLDGAERMNSYHMLRYDAEDNNGVWRETFLRALSAEGIQGGLDGYGTLHRQPAFTQLDGNWPKCYPDGAVRDLGDLPVSEYLGSACILGAPRFEDMDRVKCIDQYIEAYHKVANATDELLKYQKDHEEELAAMRPKGGRTINRVK